MVLYIISDSIYMRLYGNGCVDVFVCVCVYKTKSIRECVRGCYGLGMQRKEEKKKK